MIGGRSVWRCNICGDFTVPADEFGETIMRDHLEKDHPEHRAWFPCETPGCTVAREYNRTSMEALGHGEHHRYINGTWMIEKRLINGAWVAVKLNAELERKGGSVNQS